MSNNMIILKKVLKVKVKYMGGCNIYGFIVY